MKLDIQSIGRRSAADTSISSSSRNHGHVGQGRQRNVVCNHTNTWEILAFDESAAVAEAAAAAVEAVAAAQQQQQHEKQ